MMLETWAVANQQKAEQAQHFARPAGGFLGFIMFNPVPAPLPTTRS